MWRYGFLFLIICIPLVAADDVLLFSSKDSVLLTDFQLLVNENRFPITISGPANDTIVDRDSAGADPDVILLNISVPNDVMDNLTITFLGNLTDPVIGGQTNVILGTNVTHNGTALLYLNPNNSIYAGNWTWWGASEYGVPMDARTFIVKGALLVAYNSSENPSATTFESDSVTVQANITTAGPETRDELANTYNLIVTSTFTNTTSGTDAQAMSYTTPTWNATHRLLDLGGIGVWNASVSASDTYWYASTTYRAFINYAKMNVTENTTTPAVINITNTSTTTCRVQDQFTTIDVPGANVTFYRNTTFLGSNLTDNAGYASLSYQTDIGGVYTITCNVTDEPVLFLLAGDAPLGQNTLTVFVPPPIITATTDDTSNQTEPTREGANVTFTATADDPNLFQWQLLLCTGQGTTNGNCDATEVCHSDFVNSGASASCQHNTSGELNETYPWFAYACNNESSCSDLDNTTSPYVINHAPTTSPLISPAMPMINETITCNPGLNDIDSGDVVTPVYVWWAQNESTGPFTIIPGETSSTLVYPSFDSNDHVRCQVTPTDSRGFEGATVNSSIVVGANGTLTAAMSTADPSLKRTYARNVTVYCSVITGESVDVNLTVQDNHTGSFAQSSTVPAAIYVNESFRDLGPVVNTTASFDVTVYSTVVGNYTFQTLCSAGDTTPGSVASAPLTLEVTADPPAFNSDTIDNSSVTEPTLENANVTFTGNATDPEGDNWYVLICNSSNTDGLGNCGGTEICRSNTVLSSANASCQHNTSGEMNENYSWYAFACDIGGSCTTPDSTNAPYAINHAPSAHPHITPTAPFVTSALMCNANTTDIDSSDTVSSVYAWYAQDESSGPYMLISGQTTENLTNAFFDSNDNVLCQVTPTDSRGFAGNAANSSTVFVAQPTMSASATLTNNSILHGHSTILRGNCTAAVGDAEAVTLVIQDDHSGSYAQSSTLNTDPVSVDTPTFSLGRLASATSTTETVTIAGNSAGNYNFRVQCQAADGNPTQANSAAQALTVSPDTTPPVITNIAFTSTNTSATVNWTTDDYATSRLDYGNTSAMSNSVIDGTLVHKHALTATSLTPNTNYYYNITTCNSDGYCSRYGADNFRTLGTNTAAEFTEGYCTGHYVERGTNPVNGSLTSGDVFEYYCELPYSASARTPFEIALVVGDKEADGKFTVPSRRTGSETVVYP